MKVTFLAEAIEQQTPENIKKIEAMLRSPLSCYFQRKAKLEIGNLTDEKPGFCVIFGKDRNYSKLCLFTNVAEGVIGKFNVAQIYAYKYYFNESDEVKFDLIAQMDNQNPKIVRNSVLRISKFIKPDFSSFVRNLTKCGFYWDGGSKFDKDFVRCQIDKGNLPKDFDV